MARTEPQVNVRMPAELKARLDEVATSSGRSLTAEIVFRLQDSFGPPMSLRSRPDLVEFISDLIGEIERLRRAVFASEHVDKPPVAAKRATARRKPATPKKA